MHELLELIKEKLKEKDEFMLKIVGAERVGMSYSRFHVLIMDEARHNLFTRHREKQYDSLGNPMSD
jgi:hypothetical protein